MWSFRLKVELTIFSSRNVDWPTHYDARGIISVPCLFIYNTCFSGYNALSVGAYGDYGEEVITALCGSAVTGSIPVSPPRVTIYKNSKCLSNSTVRNADTV